MELWASKGLKPELLLLSGHQARLKLCEGDMLAPDYICWCILGCVNKQRWFLQQMTCRSCFPGSVKEQRSNFTAVYHFNFFFWYDCPLNSLLTQYLYPNCLVFSIPLREWNQYPSLLQSIALWIVHRENRKWKRFIKDIKTWLLIGQLIRLCATF